MPRSRDERLIRLVSRTGDAVPVYERVLAAVSNIWHERLEMSEQDSAPLFVQEQCTTLEIQCFVTVITSAFEQEDDDAFSLSGMDNIAIIAGALPLVHKYDCPAVEAALNTLEASAFPSCGLFHAAGVYRRSNLGPCHE